MTCLQQQDFKGRERALNYTSILGKLDSYETYTYKIYHYYDARPADVYVRTSIEPMVFDLLLAHILFEASEIENTYALGQEEIAQPVLNELYGVEVLEEATQFDEEFDLYYVWEKWCGKYAEVRNLEVLKREKLHDVLSEIVQVFA